MSKIFKEDLQSVKTKTQSLLEELSELRRSLFLEKIGDLIDNPNSWSETTLDNESSIKVEAGKFIRKHDLNSFGKYPVYGGNGKIGVHSEYVYDKGKIIIGRVGTYAGNVMINYEKAWITNNAMVISIKEDFVDEFFAQMLRMMNLNKLSTGAAQPYISTTIIKRLKIIKPPLYVQEDIASYLRIINTLEAKVIKREEHIKQLATQFN